MSEYPVPRFIWAMMQSVYYSEAWYLTLRERAERGRSHMVFRWWSEIHHEDED